MSLSPAAFHSAPRILLRSSWQTVNIGDIGHTPGILRIIDEFLPSARVTLWPGRLDRGVREMLRTHFPAVDFAEGDTDPAGNPTTTELATVFASHDFLLHGSGPSVVAHEHVAAWHRHTGKPYGIYGVTLDPLTTPHGRATEGGSLRDLSRMIDALPADHLALPLRELLDQAAFVFCRESLTLSYLRAQGVKPRRLGFAPDAAFGISIRNEGAANAFLRAHALVPGHFICVVPRTRYTPYHLVHGTPPDEEDLRRARISRRHLDRDLSKLAELVVVAVREAGWKVLICPEMTYQVEVGRLLYERLPENILSAVVCRPSYWLPDEAVATYAQAAAVVSVDNHSPIFALSQGTPSLFIRQPTDTTKGRMWEDVGLGDWFFEIDESGGSQMAARLLEIRADRAAALRRVATIMSRVRACQRESMEVLAAQFGGS